MTVLRNTCSATRELIASWVLLLVVGVVLAVAAAAKADATPVGPLPAGQTSTTTTAPGQLVAVALPHIRRRAGFVWRLARRYDSRVVRQVSEADVGANVVVVFKVVGRGNTALVFALTRGDASSKAVRQSATRSIPRKRKPE